MKVKERSMFYATQDGTPVDEEFVDKMFDKIENIFDNLEDQIENELEEDSDQSLGSLLDQAFVKVLRKLNEKGVDVELVKAIYRARLNEERSDHSCDDLHRLSAIGWNEYEDFDGNEYCRLKHGYGELVRHLAAQFNKDCVRLGEVVERVDWTQVSMAQAGESQVSSHPIKVDTRNCKQNIFSNFLF
jgi:hypothetical protein